jgi:sterol 3beta-glucosyltransferase
MVTSGSMGDVAPYTGLGVGLRDAGHDVTVATHAPFADAVAGVGLPFLPIPGDLREVLPQARGQDGRSSGTDPRALLTLLRIARPLVAELGAGIADVVARHRPDALLLSTVVAPLGYQVAEAAGIPWAGLFLQPIHPTGAFGSVLIGGRSLGAPVNRFVARGVEAGTRSLYARPVRDLRASLGLPRESMRSLQRRQQDRWPTFHGFSPAVVPRPPDWPASHRVVGYWWPARPIGWTPPPGLEDFIAAGAPPVFIGFGSMAPGHGERLAEVVLAAVRAAGVRAVVQAGWAGMAVTSDAVLSIGAVPHDWLFPKMAAVVHHAGAGTTAAGLRAGVPAVAVPVLADQPFWARRLHELGVAPAPIPFSALTAERLAAALRVVTTNPHHAARAQAIAAQMANEDAAVPVQKWLADLDGPQG